jgi:hypothetical protein
LALKVAPNDLRNTSKDRRDHCQQATFCEPGQHQGALTLSTAAGITEASAPSLS